MKQLFTLLLLQISLTNGFSQELAPASPESLGISSKAILNFIQALEKQQPNELHSFMLLRHGKIAAEGWWNPYNQDSPHMLYSLSKSFTSTAIGIAQSEKLLSIHDAVISFFPNDIPKNPSHNLKEMRIRDLLRMTTGHSAEVTDLMQKDSLSWVRGFLSQPVQYKPGTHFVYNSAATYMLSAIIQKVSGKSLHEYLGSRLFTPLAIENPSWENSPQGISIGAWGLKIKTKDIAKFGQLYLQKGKWNGKQLIPAAWVQEASALQTSNGSDPNLDWEQGYGYQFWRCRHDAYRADGAFGQFCIVFPEQQAVLAITSGSKNMGGILNLVWEQLLPAFKKAPLGENKEAQNALEDKLKYLTLAVSKGSSSSPFAKSISERLYVIKPNTDKITNIKFNLNSKTPSITFYRINKPFNYPLEHQGFAKGNYLSTKEEIIPIQSSYAWTAADTLEFRTYAFETPFNSTYSVVFKGEKMTLTKTTNVGAASDKPLIMEGEKLD